MATVTAAEAAAQAEQQKLAAISLSNTRAMIYGVRKYAVCPPQMGGGTSLAWSNPATLVFDIPTANGAFLEEFLIQFQLTLTMATGTGATYALTAGAPLTLIDNIELVYSKSQFKLPPVLIPVWKMLAGYIHNPTGQIQSGIKDTFVQNNLWTTFPVATGANTWTFAIRIPLRWLTYDIAGFLPIDGDSTKAQLKITTAAAPMSNDPRLSATYASGGTGNAVTVAGTVFCYAIFVTGENLFAQGAFGIDITGHKTLQVAYDRTMNPLSANQLNKTRIDTKQRHWLVISIIIDGNQQTSFANWSNIAALALYKDFNASNPHFAFGTPTGNNLPLWLLNESWRNLWGQDPQLANAIEGIVPWVYGTSMNLVDVDQQTGDGVLDMTPGHWPDTTIAVQPTTVGGVANITPRVETYVWYENDKGLQAAA